MNVIRREATDLHLNSRREWVVRHGAREAPGAARHRLSSPIRESLCHQWGYFDDATAIALAIFLPMQAPEPDPIPALKHQLARELVIALARWPQYAAAHFLGTDQPRISNLRNGKLGRFSLEQLVRFLNRFGADVSLEITWTTRHTILRMGTPTNRPVGRGRRRAAPPDSGRSVR